MAAMNAKKALQKKLEGGDEAEKPGKFVLKCPKG